MLYKYIIASYETISTKIHIKLQQKKADLYNK